MISTHKNKMYENDDKCHTTHVHSWQRSPVGITAPLGKSWPFTPQPTRHTQTHAVSLQFTEPTHPLLQWIKETHLDKLDSRYWVEEQLGFYMQCYIVPSHSEHDPPGERRGQYQCRWRWWKRWKVKLSCQYQTHQTVADITGILHRPPLGSVVILDTRMDTACKHILTSDCFTVMGSPAVKWLNVNSTPEHIRKKNASFCRIKHSPIFHAYPNQSYLSMD